MHTRPPFIPFVLLVLSLAPRLAAQGEPQQVLAEFKKEAKAAVKECKQGLAALAGGLETDIELFELGFDELASDDGPIDDFAAAVVDYQAQAHALVVQTSNSIGTLAGGALADLTPAGAAENVYPTGLVVGDGGALDDIRADLAKVAAKASSGALKKLSKVAKKLRSKTDMRLAFVLHPGPVLHLVPLEGAFGSAYEATLLIDVIIGFNRGSADDDGRVWVGGYANTAQGDVGVLASGPSSAGDTVSPSVVDGRWIFASDPGSQPLAEGSYLVLTQQDGGALVGDSIGLL
jgi:hypothetical protein